MHIWKRGKWVVELHHDEYINQVNVTIHLSTQLFEYADQLTDETSGFYRDKILVAQIKLTTKSVALWNVNTKMFPVNNTT